METESSDASKNEENILYEITVTNEWQETEILLKTQERDEAAAAKKAFFSFDRSYKSYFPTFLSSPISVPESVKRLIDNRLSWQFAVGGEGKVIAVLQETVLELRTSKDDYATVVGKSSVVRDPFPQWRKMSWSLDCNLLAVGLSCGSVDVFDLKGFKLFSIPKNDDLNCINCNDALVDLSFVDHRIKKSQWAAELILCNYKGQLTSYLVNFTGEYQLNFSFSFAIDYPYGISSLYFHPNLDLLFVGSVRMKSEDEPQTSTSASHYAISAWRILTDQPYYKLITTLDDDKAKYSSPRNFRKYLSSAFLFQKTKQDCIFKLSLSPDGNKLAAIHTSGCLSVWEIPSLRLFRLWRLVEQPAYNSMNTSVHEYHSTKRRLAEATKNEFYFHPIDVNWWSDLSLILARCCGSVSISSVTSLRNLLGDCCEWFEPYPVVSTAHDKGFFTLECESQITSKKRSSADEESSDDDDDDDDDNEDDPESILRRSSGWVKSALYFMTDSERFQPPRKRPKVFTKTFRLICLKSTTPEELYNRKMDNEEYGDALALAKAHNLDTDLVYQRQWKKTVVSITSIQDYLSKIKKRSWVLHECLERVSNDLDAERELLLFGLRGTSLEVLVSVGSENDDGSFVSIQNTSDDDEDDEDEDEFDDDYGFDKPSLKMKKLLSKVDFKNLSLEQKQIIITRRKLLTYFDKLNTYEVMLGGGPQAAELYDSSFFNSFRAQSALEATINFAQNSDWNKVHVMLTHHGIDILSNRLLILSNFPETTSPYEYRALLPEADVDGEICSWDQIELREQDWSEDICCTNAIGLVTRSDDTSLNDLSDSNDLVMFSTDGTKLFHSLVTKWYLQRAREIEKRTRLVDFSLELIKLGQERNIQGLGELHDELLTLETLIYECRVECTLDGYENMADMEKVLLLMKTSNNDVFITNLRRWLIPFMTRLDSASAGSSTRLFREYLLHMSKDSLEQCLLVFQNSRMELTNPIIQPTSELIDLALCCVYTCTESDQLTVANSILECLPSRNYGPDTPEMLKLHDQVDEFERHLKAGFILNRHGIKESLPVIRQCQDDVDRVKDLLIKLTRNAGKSCYSESEWEKLLVDILELQRILRCISPTLCYEIFVESLLCSGANNNINMSRRYMELSSNTTSMLTTKLVSYQRSVELVLSAAREYFNSSTSLTDPTMDLARTCLGLIVDNPPSIEAEMDLISALSILNELLDSTSTQSDDRNESTILPLQVRLCADRIELIRSVLNRSSKSYKYPQRLLKLAYLLRVSGDDKREREGRVLTLAAEAAFEKKDYIPCSQLCVQVMEGGYEEGWKVCNLLGQCNQYEDLKLKCRLLSFSVIYCPSDEIEAVIQCRSLIETQLLQNEIRSQIEVNEPSVETSVINVWKQALKFVRLENEENWNFYDKNMNLDRQGCLSFYLSMINRCHPSEIDVDYKRFAAPNIPHHLKFTRNLFRAALLAETVTRGENHCVNSEILLELSRETLSNDTALGLAYLLTVSSIKDVERYFTELPRSEISFQLMCYYFALKFCFYADEIDFKTIFSLSPDDVINMALNQNVYDTSNENLNLSKTLLKNHYQKLTDLTQGKLLHDLGRGVDVIRFSVDDEYKKDTILGLAMTLEDDVYETSVALALKYNLPLSELYRNHLQFLFSQSDIPTNELEKRIWRLKLLDELKKQSEDTCVYLSKFIYPTIDGTDHARLIYYYQLMEECGTKGSMESSSVQSRMRLLKKMTKLAPNLDFKKLTDSEDPLSILFPSLNANNVHSIAKLANQLTSKDGALDQSSVYVVWTNQLFFNPSSKELTTYSEWVHQFESCHEFVRKLNATGITKLVNNIVFSRQSIDKIPLESRKEIVKRLLKLSRQEMKKNEDWQKCVSHLTNAKNHLDWLSNDQVQLLKDGDLGQRVDELDLAMSQPEEVHRVLVKCVIDGESVESLQNLVSVVPPECSFAPGDVILDALRNRVEELRKSLSDDEPLESIRKIVEQIRVHLNSGGDLVEVEDVVSVVRTFFSDDDVPIEVRLRVLEELDKTFCLDDYDRSLILFYRTQLIVSSAFPEILVSSNDVCDNISRDSYFDFLLSNSTSLTQLRFLCQLLFSWPLLPSCSLSDVSRSPWIRLLSSILTNGDDESCHEFISLFTNWPESVPRLSLRCLEHLLPLIPTDKTQIYYLKFCLTSDHAELHQRAIDRINENQMSSVDYDDILFNLILSHHLTSRIVTSDLFAPFCSCLFSTNFDAVPAVAKELKDAGFVVESGALLLRHHSTPRSLQLFNAAIRVTRHWFTK